MNREERYNMIEFISYDGKWPNLCSGTLTIKVNGTLYELENVMISGGCIMGGPHTNWDMWAEQGSWRLDLQDYPDLKPYEDEITNLVNENVEYGCCGGCI